VKYNRNGEEYSVDTDSLVFAEQLEGSRQTVFSVLTHNNNLYDPLGADSNRESNLNLVLSKTNEDAFKSYMKYLKTNSRIYITKAQRSFLNG
tara:strand:- start:469 stop:744 length:276 start_codon:yes stop_codon:yes gene_type:complete